MFAHVSGVTFRWVETVSDVHFYQAVGELIQHGESGIVSSPRGVPTVTGSAWQKNSIGYDAG